MKKTIFKISGMDCPSEENLIRTALADVKSVRNLVFNIPERKLSVFHEDDIENIEKSIDELDLGSKKLSSEDSSISNFKDSSDHSQQRKLLWAVLFINFAFFIIEMTAGLLSGSMGLTADSLDMLADSFVYSISLFAVGGTIARKKRVAGITGYLQLSLASLGFFEVLHRFFGDFPVPDFSTMIIVSIFALAANSLSLYLLQLSRGKEEAHFKATMICTSNDVIMNLGVIVAGILVNLLNSKIPDLLVGIVVFALVMRGAFRILKLRK